MRLAWPIIGGMTSQNILNLIDIAMVGRLGAAALAGVGLAGFLNFMAVGAIMGLSAGVQATSARRVGEGRDDESAVPLNNGLLLALAAGLPLSILLWWFAPMIVATLVDDPAVVGEGTAYWQGRLVGVVAIGGPNDRYIRCGLGTRVGPMPRTNGIPMSERPLRRWLSHLLARPRRLSRLTMLVYTSSPPTSAAVTMG